MTDCSEQNKIYRPDWDKYFLSIAKLAALRSTCLRRKVGAVIVKDRDIIATGYNGAPVGIKHCSETGCLRDQLSIPSGQRHELCRGLHAEQNAVIRSAVHGISIKESTIYCTNLPCVVCAKMIINARIKKIFYIDGYPDELTEKLLQEANVEYVQTTL